MKSRTMLALVVVVALLTMQAGDTWARARGGGSRGSRSFSAPRPAPMPSSPSQSFGSRSTAPAPAPAPALQPPVQRPGFFRGFGGALAGFALGGLLGSMLFGGMGRGFGIGFMDILILGAVAFIAWQFLRRRREAEQPAYATDGPSRYGAATASGGTAIGTVFAPGAHGGGEDDVAKGVEHLRQMDPGFDPGAIAAWAQTFFGNLQSCVAMRDVGMIRDRLAPEMYNVLQGQCQELKTARRTNRVEKVQLDRAEMTEAWQEGGYDFVTVYFSGTMFDYTVDDRSGDVVEGSKTEPQAVEEYWTFTRPVGPRPWRLSAIQTQ